MKSAYTTTTLVWICNIALAVSVISVIFNLYMAYTGYDFFERQIEELQEVNLVTSISQSMFGNIYLYQSVYDSESDVRREHFYLVPGNNVYRFNLQNAPKVNAQKLQEDMSSRDWFGFRTLSVYADPTEVPLIFATPGIELADGHELNRHFRLGYFSYAGYAIYLVLLFWFIRRFLIGLKANTFFTHENTFNLRIVGFMVLAAPILHYLWYKLIEPSPEALLSIQDATLHGPVNYIFKYELLIAGLILVVISQAFDYGVKLQKEQELTI